MIDVRALAAEIARDSEAKRILAECLATELRDVLRPSTAPEDRWLTTRQASQYLGLSVPALHRLTARRAIPFEQDGPGCKCWFSRSELDRWRCGQPTN
jgi:excisionase family DNA binding protein